MERFSDLIRGRGVVVALVAATTMGCVTVAEHRKLEAEVIDLKRARTVSDAPREQLADVNAELDRLSNELRLLTGRMEEVERESDQALSEARKARKELATRLIEADAGREGVAAVDPAGGQQGDPADAPSAEEDGIQGSSAEVAAYRAAYSAWRADDYTTCIDRFRKFLQTYPASPYADDSAFWMADCHFKQGDYKNAVLRFDDVVRNYPSGNKAPDALYRQGEALLKLGPGFHEAAKRAFERVLKEYPDSRRADQAREQLDMLSTG